MTLGVTWTIRVRSAALRGIPRARLGPSRAIAAFGLAAGLAACGAGASVATLGSPSPADSIGSSKAAAGKPALDAALRAGLRSARAPGAQAAIVRCGQLVWAGAAGVTDRSTRRAVVGDTRFVLASTTKTVTATMIMQLVEQGRLTFATPLSRFYPGLPNAKRITIEMLLRHTSGLPDYEDDPSIQRSIADPRHAWTRAEVLRSLRRAQFAPGARYAYTNANFVVLGGIVEKVSGLSVADGFASGIAPPLGFADTMYLATSGDSDRFAHPHQVADDGSLSDSWVHGYGVASDAIGPVWTDGGLISTAKEIATFGDALFAARIVKPATLALMTAIDRYDGGLGLATWDAEGRTWLGHPGSYGGFESELWTDGARGLTIAVTTNRDELDSATVSTSETIWRAVARAYERAAPTSRCGG